MPKPFFNPTQKNAREINLFRARLLAKLVVAFISFTQVALRVGMILSHSISTQSAALYLNTIPFLFVMLLIILGQYLAYRKLGVRILKYTKYIDAVFSLVFTGEWIVILNGIMIQSTNSSKIVYPISTLVGFTAFGWRTLLQTLITQEWKFKILPPIAAYIYFLWYSVTNQPSQTTLIIIRGLLQLVYIILIFYFEHRINFTSLMGNLQQEQWMKVNEFILDNIPESIAIVDLQGNCTFMSEHFKKLLRKRNHSLDVKHFWKSITDIQQQEGESDLVDSFALELNMTSKRGPLGSRGDLNDEIKFENPVGYSLEDLINTFCGLISKGNVKEKAFQVFNGKFKHEEEAKERSMEIKISYINQDPNKYILLLIRDTTQRDLVLTLEGNNKYKDHLLASVSHELRTPLNGNINLVEAAIRSNEVSDKIKENLLVPALKSGKFLLNLINDILDMSQIKAQKLRLVFQKGSLKDTLINTVQLLELHAKKKGVTLETDLDPLLPENFCTDHVRLSQIVLNLINNSIKFTQKGKVKLVAEALSDRECVRLSVEDTGIGMTEEDKNKLFKDFTHIDIKNRESLNPTGVGLGLKIALDLAELLGPKQNEGIRVDSVINKGSIFSFIIENKEIGFGGSQDKLDNNVNENSALVAEEHDVQIESTLEGKLRSTTRSFIRFSDIGMASLSSRLICSCAKVLVVDDDPFNILAYEAILSSLGIKFDCVYNGRSAIERMLNKVRYPCAQGCRPYRLVFMDEEMPGMTGSETIAEIKTLQKQNLLPGMTLIGCTAHHDAEQIEKFCKSGIVEHVQKPISTSVIKKILEKYSI